MDGVISLGPLMIATDRALALAAIWGFLGLGALVGARTGSRAGRAASVAVLAGIIAARAGFIIQNRDAFMVEPWSMVAIWQGGFAPLAGVAAAGGVVAIMLGRQGASGLMLAGLAAITLAHAGVAAAIAPEPRPFPAPLAVRAMSGETLDLDRLRGRPFVINLWATWCPPCRREMPMVIEVAAGAGIPVLLVNQGEDAARVRAYLAAQRLSADPVVLDPGQRIAAATGAAALPTTLFVDGDGRVVRRHAGEISRATLSAAIRELKAGAP